MSVYQRGANWYIDFHFHGKRIRQMIGSRKDAEKVIAKKRTEINENKFLDIRKEPEAITFHEFAKQYLAYAKTNKKPSTCGRELCIMRSFDIYFKGKHIHEITTWQIEKWKSQREKTCKPASVNRELALLKHMLSMAVKWKRLKESPAREVKGLKGAAKRVRYLLPDEIQILLPNCDGLLRGYLRPLVTLALNSGARKGELQNLQWPEVNFGLGIISFLDTKNGERRDVPMNETARATLEELERTGEFVFPNRNGKRIDDAQVQIAFTAAVEKAGITDFHFHDLRHTFASNLVMAGVDLYTVGELLGHKDLKMTKRYAHLAPAYRAKAVNVLDRVFDLALNPPQAEKVVQLRP